MSEKATHTGKSLFRSAASSMMGFGLAVLVGFVLSPYVVHTLGKEVYGYWTLIVAITSQLMVLDLGIRNAVVRFLSAHRATGDTEACSKLLTAASLLLAGLSFFGFVALYLVSFSIESWFSISSHTLAAVKLAFLLMSIDATIELAFGVFDGALAGSEQYDTLHGINSARLLVNAICVVLTLDYGLGIIGIASAALFSRLLQRMMSAHFAFRSNPGVQIRPHFFDFMSVRKVAGYGAWAALCVASIRIIHQVDALVIGASLGASAVTLYAIPVMLVEYFRLLSQSTATIMTPRLSGLLNSDDLDSIQVLLRKWISFGQLLAVAICVPLLVTGGDFIVLWMGKDFEACEPILQVLTLSAFFVVPSLGFMNYFYAADEHHRFAKITITEAIVNLVLSIILVNYIGLIGVAFGTLIPSILFRGALLTKIGSDHAGIRFGEYLSLAFLKPLPLALGYTATLLILQQSIDTNTWITFLLCNGAAFALFLVVAYLFFLDGEDKAYIKRRLGR